MDSWPEHIKQVAEGSLRRLKVGAIDPFVSTVLTRTCLRYPSWTV